MHWVVATADQAAICMRCCTHSAGVHNAQRTACCTVGPVGIDMVLFRGNCGTLGMFVGADLELAAPLAGKVASSRCQERMSQVAEEVVAHSGGS